MKKYMAVLFTTLSLAMGFTVLSSTTANATTPDVWVHEDDTPDYILVSPGSDRGAAAATDLESLEYRTFPTVAGQPKILRITYYFKGLNKRFGYQLGVLVRKGDRVGEVYSGGYGMIGKRKTLDADVKFCRGTWVRVNMKQDKIVQEFPYSCLPYKNDITLSPYVGTFNADGSTAGWDAFNTQTPVWTFTP